MFSYIWNKRKTEINIPSYVSIRKVSGELPLLWGEHCVECAMPLCYTSCKMYVPRIDGRCLRFEDGVRPVVFYDHSIGAYIRIKKWGKLEAVLPKGIYGIPITAFFSPSVLSFIQLFQNDDTIAIAAQFGGRRGLALAGSSFWDWRLYMG